jgi:hypothetical protein
MTQPTFIEQPGKLQMQSPFAACSICGAETTWNHDHRADNTGLDDGPLLRAPRKKPPPKEPAELSNIRMRAWATRRQKYGQHGHR